MKILKTLKGYMETLSPEEFCIFSNEYGSKNLLILDSEQFKKSIIWQSDEFSQVPAVVIAHGFNDSGELAICSNDIPPVIMGTGKKIGFALFIQCLDNVFYIAICSDKSGKHERFFLTATNDKNIFGIILTILEHFCLSQEDLGQISTFLQKGRD